MLVHSLDRQHTGGCLIESGREGRVRAPFQLRMSNGLQEDHLKHSRSRLRRSLFRVCAVSFAVLTLVGGSSLVSGQAARADNQATIYVSPSGNDANSGADLADAVQTLTRAQQLVRAMNADMSGDITVQLAGGTYRLTSPLTFAPADSGTNGYDVDWTSAAGQTAVVSGADQIGGWHETSAAKDIWAASVPSNLQTRQIYVNGVRAFLASGVPPISLTRTSSGYRASSSAMAAWKNPSEIDFVYPGSLGYMVEPICPVASIKGKVITMAQPCWSDSNDRGAHNIVGYPGSQLELPAYIENAYELLTQPGQFYLDQAAHMLYYIPRPGQDMETADVEAPALQTLVQGTGTAADPIENISFSSIQFSYATWLQPGTPAGFSEEQAGYFISGQNAYATEGLCHTVANGTCPFGSWNKEPGNVQFSYDQNLSFLNDDFVHLGAAALNLDDGTQNATIEGSIFTDISGNGIELGDVDRNMATGNDQTANLTVANNSLYGFPVEFEGGVPIVAGYVSGADISHNDIHDIPWAAISMGWGGWLDKIEQSPVQNNMQDNLISDNLIYNFMEGLKDGGGVYTQGIQGPNMANGLHVSGNVIHDQLDWGGALKSDDGTSYVTYSGNVLYDNNYDWDGPLKDYDSGANTTYDPVTLENNYWQQGEFSANQYPGVDESGNSVISGGADAPSGIVGAAGLTPAYDNLLSYAIEGNAPPAAPRMLSALYAFKGKAYMTWHPSYDAGSSAVTSYTLQGCRSSATGQCVGSKLARVNVPAATLDSAGYAVYPSLGDGKTYAITVTANNAGGSSIASIPAIISPIAKVPKLPGSPPAVTARAAAGGVVTLIWTSPKTTKGVQNLIQVHGRHSTRRDTVSVDANNFILGYTIKSSSGQSYALDGHIELVETNTGGRVLYVITGLTAGKSYSFSVSAFNAVGTSKKSTKSNSVVALQ